MNSFLQVVFYTSEEFYAGTVVISSEFSGFKVGRRR
jgi:hypothetical protein